MKVILITGCSGGIGSEICKSYRQESNDNIIIGVDISNNKYNNFINLFIKADLSNTTNHEKIIQSIKNKYNKLDIIINVAAIQICKPIWTMEETEWDNIYNCNVKTIFLFSKYGLDLLKKSYDANIINIASIHSVATSNKIAAYASSKAALVGLTKNLAIELAQFNIRVNCISPGAIDTPMLRSGLRRGHLTNDIVTDDELISMLGSKHLNGHVGQTKDIANLVLFLSNKNNSSFINGANIIIDGGASIKLSTE